MTSDRKKWEWKPKRTVAPLISQRGRNSFPSGSSLRMSLNTFSGQKGKGPVQIMSVRLAGKMPEIDHCDQLVNAHVLSVEVKLNGARIETSLEPSPL